MSRDRLSILISALAIGISLATIALTVVRNARGDEPATTPSATAQAARTQTIYGKCTRVLDGDTIDVTSATLAGRATTYRIRLAYIDAPEKSQDYGAQSAAYLKARVLQKTVMVRWTKQDRYKRILGEVTAFSPTDHAAFSMAETSTVNDHMLAFGWAWQYREYDKDQWRADLEALARKHRKGLWAGEKPIPPWEFRAAKRKPKADTTPARVPGIRPAGVGVPYRRIWTGTIINTPDGLRLVPQDLTTSDQQRTESPHETGPQSDFRADEALRGPLPEAGGPRPDATGLHREPADPPGAGSQ
jgi:endonuclease YncB( thermonuclease family)